MSFTGGQRARHIADGVIEVSTRFERWLKDHPGSVTGDVESIIGEVSSLRRRARIIARASERPASIAIFGESQVGKSYLVSTLAKGKNPLVEVRIGNKQHNFLTEINPEGNKESTGLVTRFSINPPPKTTDAKPVYLELLSELDVVKILVNTYYNDIKHKTTAALSEEAVASAVTRAKSSARGPSVRHIIGDDINDLKEYMEREIFTVDRLKALTPSVWSEFQKAIPMLPLDERIAIYSLLWLQEKPLSAAARVLIGALEGLGHADGAIVGVEAMLPRESSIIDVETLKGFETGKGDPIEVESAASGARASIARPTLCALTAEVYMQLASPPGGAINACDLLDFPGARARGNHESLTTGIEVDGLSMFYRRGKVDFLFKRYTANQELAALLLCRNPTKPPEVHDIKNTVYAWIATTLGDVPAKRTGPNPLFVLFTRFDELIAPKFAGGTPNSTLENPIKNTFVEYFNQNPSDNWPTNWNGRSVFNNCHWYRNPKATRSPLFTYSESGEETGISPDQSERVAKFRDAFLSTSTLNMYFFDPQKAWESVIGCMDGGVTHIAERLAATIDPKVKFQQLEARIADEAAKLRGRMDALCVSDDLDAERNKRRERAKQTIMTIQQNVMPQHQFGFMIEKLQITPDKLRAPLRKALSESYATGETQPAGSSGGYKANLDDIFGDGSAAASENANAQAAASAYNDVPVEVAERIIHLWAGHLAETTSDIDWRRRLRLGEDHAANLADELIRIAQHQQIRDRVATLVHEHRQRVGMGQMQGLDLLLRQLTDLLNSFTFYLGYDRVPADKRPKLGASGLILFQQPLAAGEAFQVSDRRGAFNQALYDSWLRAVWLRTNEAIDAIDPSSSGKFDRVANDKLKSSIKAIDALV